jgi:hypothetical protein
MIFAAILEDSSHERRMGLTDRCFENYVMIVNRVENAILGTKPERDELQCVCNTETRRDL